MACWCMSYEGWRFLEADQCGTFTLVGLRYYVASHSSTTTATKLMLTDLLETVANRIPCMRFGTLRTNALPKLASVVTHNVARLSTQGLNKFKLPLSTSMLDGPTASGSRHWCCCSILASAASTRRETTEPICGWEARGTQNVPRTRLRISGLRQWRVRALKKAGAYTQHHTIAGSNAWVAPPFRVPRHSCYVDLQAKMGPK